MGLDEFLTALGADECIPVTGLTVYNLRQRIVHLETEHDRLLTENAVLRSYLSDDLLRRIAVEHDWPHDPDNTCGHWCCDEHRTEFLNLNP